MHFYDLLQARVSVREYTDRPVPEEMIRRVLDAARNAPSACNKQPWHFFVVRDAETRRRIFPHERQAWIANAPVVLVACSYPERAWVRQYDGKNHADLDLAIAMEHMVLAATEEGLGSCWICAFDPDLARQALDLPAEMTPVAITPLGFSDAPCSPRNRKSLDEIVTWQ